MMSGLLLIDIQNDYFKGGNAELYHPEQAADNARLVLEYFRKSGLPIFFIRHLNLREGAKTFVPDTKGSEIHEIVAPRPEECVIIKHVPNSFYNTGLAQKLSEQGIHHLVVCGMMSHMCIDTTVRAAKDFGLTVTLLHDACTTKDLKWNDQVIPAEIVHNTFMASLNGGFSKTMTVKEYLTDINSSTGSL